ENGWTTSNNISIQSDNPIFKGNFMQMPGARSADFPTYIYQKVVESKLKPYTRYIARGFVESSQELELLVTRYAEEVDAIMNVPNDLAYKGSFNSCGGFDRCKSPASQTMDGNMSVMNSMRINNNIQNASYASPETCQCVPKTASLKMCHDLHEFSFHIDTGEIDLNENLGIWMLFKISSPDGYASLDNLEIIEDGPLVGESLAYVKKREKKWKDTMDKKQLETQKAYGEAKMAVDALFTNSQYTALKYETTRANIIAADTLVQSIPYVYNEWLPNLPGMNYDNYTELQNQISQANDLYNLRNVIKNGDFTNGLMHWHATPYAEVQQINGTSVLVIPNWSANVSQNICLQHNHGYMLRVTGKKEGNGNGYVKICDCAGGIETLTFTSCENSTTGTFNELEDYVTKTVDIFPDTDQVRVEISETEG
ncbi:toxin Cry1Ac domain D-VI-related protein, partial [Lysinibacillus sp. UGB7]|uniref:toxin Cry1Ac domain D-VI-related protein n=1 Tax=Lysinibacillus sp. UGB7 TaxID=3411039 RepID=UPI003B7C4F77